MTKTSHLSLSNPLSTLQPVGALQNAQMAHHSPGYVPSPLGTRTQALCLLTAASSSSRSCHPGPSSHRVFAYLTQSSFLFSLCPVNSQAALGWASLLEGSPLTLAHTPRSHAPALHGTLFCAVTSAAQPTDRCLELD